MVSGDGLVAVLAVFGNPPPSGLSLSGEGWEKVKEVTCEPSVGNKFTTAVFVKRAGGSEPSEYSFTWTGTQIWRAGWMAAYKEVATSGPIYSGTPTLQAAASTTNPKALAITTALPNCTLVWFTKLESAATLSSPPAGFTSRVGLSDEDALDKEQAAAGSSGEIGGTLSAAKGATTGMVALAPITKTVEGKGSGTGTGSGTGKGTRGRLGKGQGAGTGSGTGQGTRGRQGKGEGSGSGSGSGSGTRGRLGAAAGSGSGSGAAEGVAKPPPPVPATRVLSEPIDDALFVELKAADGRPMRLSGVEGEAANIAQQIKTSTSAPGGHRDASLVLTRDPRLDWSDLNLIDEVIIRGRTQPLGRNVFEGMAQQFPSQLGDGHSIALNAVGHQELLNENETWRALYVKLGFEGWGDTPLWRRREINAGGSPQGKIPVNVGSGGLSWEVPTETINNLEHSEAWWEAPAGVKVSALGYRGKQSGDTSKFEAPTVRGVDSETTAAGALEQALTLDDTPRVASLSAARRRLMLRMLFTSATTQPSSATQRSYSELAEYGDTGVPLREVPGQLPGVYFHDVLAHILSTGAPDLRYRVGADGTIVPNTSFVMQDFAPIEPAPPKEAIEKGNAYFLNNWAVWDRKEFWWHPWDPQRLTWEASIAGGAQWSPVGRQAFSLLNGIVVSYTDAAGVSRTAGPPGSGCDYEDASLADSDPSNPYTRRGRRRWARLSVGFPLPYPSTAFQLGFIVLAESRLPQRSGTLVVRPRGPGHIPAISHPTMGQLPIWAPRSGDYVKLMDWPEPEPFRIIESDYDGATKTLTAQLDSGAARLSAILERSGSRLSLL